jgi:hypothetical protein
VKPDGEIKRRPAWYLATAIRAIDEHGRREGLNYGWANTNDLPPLPFGVRTNDATTGLCALIAMFSLTEVADVVARLVAAVGGDDDQIYLAALLAPEVLRGRLALAFEKSGLNPKVLPNVPPEVDRDFIAKVSGRDFDPEALAARCRERFAA